MAERDAGRMTIKHYHILHPTMPPIYENRQHVHAAMKEKKRAKLLEEIDALCTRARDM